MCLWPAILKSGATNTKISSANFTRWDMELQSRLKVSTFACHCKDKTNSTKCQTALTGQLQVTAVARTRKKGGRARWVNFKRRVLSILFQKLTFSRRKTGVRIDKNHHPPLEVEWLMLLNLQLDSCRWLCKNKALNRLRIDCRAEVVFEQLRHKSETLLR
jgi:hypothetical protein